MPMKIVCADCNFLLHNSKELVPFNEVLNDLHGKCPKCGRQLSPNPISVSVNGKPFQPAENKAKPKQQPKKQEKWWKK